MDYDVIDLPRDATTALGLSTGTRYAIQNIDPRGRVFVRIQADAPSVDDRANIILPWQFGYAEFDAGERIWLWSPDAGGSVVYVTEE